MEADIENVGGNEVKVALRVDNEGHWQTNPGNTEALLLKPDEAKTIRVTFGKSYGGKPGYDLNSARIVAFRVFADRPKELAKIHVKRLNAFH